ncbi:DUF3298 domain-containing protein [Patescibacteria group bacterium]
MKKLLTLLVFATLLTGCDEEFIDFIDDQIEEADKIKVIEDVDYPEDLDLPDDYVWEETEGAHMWPEVYEEETGTYIIDVQYPQWEELDTLNDMVAEVVFDEIEYFKDSIDDWVDDEFYDNTDDMKSGLTINFEIYHNEWDYLSIGFASYIYYEGAAHGMMYTIPYNLDFETFEEIELLDIFVDDGGGWLDAISYMSIQRLKEQLYEDEFVEDYWIEEGAGPDSVNFSAWTLTDDSIIFHFDPYQVAAYAAGPQQVEFTFDELYALLNEPWASKGE